MSGWFNQFPTRIFDPKAANVLARDFKDFSQNWNARDLSYACEELFIISRQRNRSSADPSLHILLNHGIVGCI